MHGVSSYQVQPNDYFSAVDNQIDGKFCELSSHQSLSDELNFQDTAIYEGQNRETITNDQYYGHNMEERGGRLNKVHLIMAKEFDWKNY